MEHLTRLMYDLGSIFLFNSSGNPPARHLARTSGCRAQKCTFFIYYGENSV